jgi:MoxR-like ATPase
MTPRAALLAALDADIPTMLWGPPGGGKTSLVRSIAAERGDHLEVVILSRLEPQDLGGLPIVGRDGEVRISAPDWARRAAKMGGIVFFDEFSCAAPALRAAALRAVQEREVAGVDLSRCRIVGAANPSDSAATGGVLDAASANRWLHLDFAPSASEIADGIEGGWGQRPGPQAAAVAALLRAHPALAAGEPGDDPRGWPSARTWTMVASLPAREAILVAGLVGGAAARQAAEYWRALDLPAPADILAGRAKLPPRGDQRLAALAACGAHALGALAESGPQPQPVVAFWRLISGLPAEQRIPAARRAAAAWGRARLVLVADLVSDLVSDAQSLG